MDHGDCSTTPQTEGIRFSSILAVLWNRRKLIIYGTATATLLSIAISFLLPKVYRSEGFFQLGNPSKKIVEIEIDKMTIKEMPSIAKKTAQIGMPVFLYKKISSQFFDLNRLYQMAKQQKGFNEEDLQIIENRLKKPEDISKLIKPVYALAKEDLREFVQIPQDESNSVIGLNLSYEAYSAEKAYAHVSFFGKFVRDCLLYLTLKDYVMEGYSKTISQLHKNDNDIIKIQFDLSQNINKLKDIQAIFSKYPESKTIESRQMVVSIKEGGDRFMSPLIQLVGIESALADLHRDLAELERDREKLSVKSEYFSRCYNELAKVDENGETLFLRLTSIKEEVFNKRDLSKNEVKEVFNELNIDLQTYDFTFFLYSRFISGPTLPTEPIRPWKSLIILLSFFGSFFFLIAFAAFFHWWQGHTKSIKPSNSVQ
jgi:LPS O-antigen subunit length determinant protein (WzzB/FepE family)